MHSWQFVAQGKLGAAHKGLIHAATIMATTCATLLSDPDLLGRARQEFETRLVERPYDNPIPAGTLAPPLRPRRDQ
jgi:aminobenzoyl-glutamate utilization protein B